MTKTLEQNGVKDEDEEFYELNFNEEDWLPAIHVYFNDDLTEAWEQGTLPCHGATLSPHHISLSDAHHNFQILISS